MKIPGLSLAANLPMMSMPAVFDAAIRLLGPLMIFLAVLLAGRWLTELTAPRPVAKLPSISVAPQENNLKLVGKLFGAGEAQAQSLDGLQLAGVFANSRGGGFATFRTRSGAISVFAGGDVAPGIKLKQIEGDRVIITSAGGQKELRLSDGGAQSSTTSQGSTTPQGKTVPLTPEQISANIAQAVEANQQASQSRRAARPQEEN